MSKKTMTPEEFRSIRESLGLNQRELAEQMCVAPITVYFWESGRRKLTPDKIRLLELVSEKLKENT